LIVDENKGGQSAEYAVTELYNHFNNVVDSNNWIEVSMKRAAKLAIQEKVPVLHVYHYFAVLLDPNAKSKIVTYILPDRKGNKKQILEVSFFIICFYHLI
jgi:hypothetical protein